MAKITDVSEKIAKSITENHQKIEDKFTHTFLEEDGSLKTGKIGEAVIEGYKKIEDGVVSGYKRIEESVVGGFNKVSDKFVEKLFAKEGESVEDAKARLSGQERAD